MSGYKHNGQCDAKRAARYMEISLCSRMLGGFEGKRSLVLLGPDAGDVRALRHLNSVVVGVDRDKSFVEKARVRFQGDPMTEVRHGVVPECLRKEEKFDFIFLDFCAHLSRSLMLTVWRTVDRHLSQDGVCVVGYQRGREKVDYKAKQTQVSRRCDAFSLAFDRWRQKPTDGNGEAVSAILSAHGITLREIRFLFGGWPEDLRVVVLEEWLWSFSQAHGRPWTLASFGELRYQSAVPMTYITLKKFEARKFSDFSSFLDQEAGAPIQLDDCTKLVRKIAVDTRGDSCERTAALLNISSNTVRAWRAVATKDRARNEEALRSAKILVQRALDEGRIRPLPHLLNALKREVW